jgi:hypothetical protein
MAKFKVGDEIHPVVDVMLVPVLNTSKAYRITSVTSHVSFGFVNSEYEAQQTEPALSYRSAIHFETKNEGEYDTAATFSARMQAGAFPGAQAPGANVTMAPVRHPKFHNGQTIVENGGLREYQVVMHHYHSVTKAWMYELHSQGKPNVSLYADDVERDFSLNVKPGPMFPIGSTIQHKTNGQTYTVSVYGNGYYGLEDSHKNRIVKPAVLVESEFIMIMPGTFSYQATYTWTNKFKTHDRVRKIGYPNRVAQVDAYNPAVDVYMYNVDDGAGGVLSMTERRDVFELEWEPDASKSYTLNIPAGFKVQIGGVPIPSEAHADGVPISVNVDHPSIKCDHRWKPSSSVEGKTKWCTNCDERA